MMSMTKLIQRFRDRRNDNDRWPPGGAVATARLRLA
jgi:hypothetical protein